MNERQLSAQVDHWRERAQRAEAERDEAHANTNEGLQWLRDDIEVKVETIKSLIEQVQTLERKLRDAPLGGEGSHWADCWRSHIDCAAARVESLEEQLETLRLALHAIADEGQYLSGSVWEREPAVIATLALAEVSSPASEPKEG